MRWFRLRVRQLSKTYSQPTITEIGLIQSRLISINEEKICSENVETHKLGIVNQSITTCLCLYVTDSTLTLNVTVGEGAMAPQFFGS